MRRMGTKIGVILFVAVAFLLVATSIASAADYGRRRGGGGGRYSVAEPAAIALLGAGLVSLGLYAKRKRDKK